MKRIIIGRGIDCDIVIPDEKDNVSRHHLVISFGLLGKMTISDTSSNGTFVNDRKLLKGASVPVTREDKVRLGSQWTLDWSLVKDPYIATPKDDAVKKDGLKKASPKMKNTKKASRSVKKVRRNYNVKTITDKKPSTENMKVKEMSSEKMPIVN